MSEEKNKTAFVFLKVDKRGNTYKNLSKLVSGEAQWEEVHCTNAADVLSVIQQYGRGIVFFDLSQKEDLVEVVNCLAQGADFLKDNVLRILGVSQLQQPGINVFLTRKQCSEVISPNLNPKAMFYKCQRWARFVETSYKNLQKKRKREQQKAESEAKANSKMPVHWASAIPLASDCWLIPKKSDIRQKPLGWELIIGGPPPSTGHWEPARLKEFPDQKGWRWYPKEYPNPFISEEGGWYFFGKEPQYDWVNLSWVFFSDSPQLCFRKSDDTLVFRVSIGETEMTVAQNGPRASDMAHEISEAVNKAPEYQELQKKKGNKKGDDGRGPLVLNKDQTKGSDTIAIESAPSLDENDYSINSGKKKGKGAGLVTIDGGKKKSGTSITQEGIKKGKLHSATSEGPDPKNMTFLEKAMMGVDEDEVDWLEKLKPIRFEIKVPTRNDGLVTLHPIDIFDTELSVSCGGMFFKKDEELQLDIIVEAPQRRLRCKMVGQVFEMEIVSPTQMSVTISLVDYKLEDLQALHEIFLERQFDMAQYFGLATG